MRMCLGDIANMDKQKMCRIRFEIKTKFKLKFNCCACFRGCLAMLFSFLFRETTIQCLINNAVASPLNTESFLGWTEDISTDKNEGGIALANPRFCDWSTSTSMCFLQFVSLTTSAVCTLRVQLNTKMNDKSEIQLAKNVQVLFVLYGKTNTGFFSKRHKKTCCRCCC